MADPHQTGRRGESLAASYLRSRGWRILARNWRFHHKEIDLVVERDGVVAFVEVKARGAGAWADPLHGIDARKRRELATAARGWIALRGQRGDSYRFDAVRVLHGSDGVRVDHVESAWTL